MEKVYEKIRKLRKDRNLTQSQVAEMLGITSGGFSLIELGRSDLSLTRVKQLAEIFEVSPAYLLGFDTPDCSELEGRVRELEKDKKALQMLQDWQLRALSATAQNYMEILMDVGLAERVANELPADASQTAFQKGIKAHLENIEPKNTKYHKKRKAFLEGFNSFHAFLADLRERVLELTKDASDKSIELLNQGKNEPQ